MQIMRLTGPLHAAHLALLLLLALGVGLDLVSRPAAPPPRLECLFLLGVIVLHAVDQRGGGYSSAAGSGCNKGRHSQMAQSCPQDFVTHGTLVIDDFCNPLAAD